jgi:uncharacterized protein DUF4389
MSEHAQPLAGAEPHPIRLVVEDDLRRTRLTVFFRPLLAIPYVVWGALWTVAAVAVAIVSWIAILSSGRSPDALHDFLARYVRYVQHMDAFVYLVADPFPGFLGEAGTYPVDVEIEPPAEQGRWAVGFRIILAVPALLITQVLQSLLQILAFLGWFYALATGRMHEGMRNLSAFCLRYQAQTYGYVFLLTGRYPALSPGPTV